MKWADPESSATARMQEAPGGSAGPVQGSDASVGLAVIDGADSAKQVERGFGFLGGAKCDGVVIATVSPEAACAFREIRGGAGGGRVALVAQLAVPGRHCVEKRKDDVSGGECELESDEAMGQDGLRSVEDRRSPSAPGGRGQGCSGASPGHERKRAWP